MNQFLELHSDADYRNSNRDYYTYTWDYIISDTDQLIPFQFVSSGSDAITIETEDKDGNFSDITSSFTYTTTYFTWTKTGGGTWSNSGSQITAGSAASGSYQTSNTFTLTEGYGYYFELDTSAYTVATFTVELEKDGVQVWGESVDSWDGKKSFTVDETGSDYTIVITCETGTGTVTANTPFRKVSYLVQSGDYWWYTGEQLPSNVFSGVFRLRVTCGSDVFYSDWCDACGFTGKMKYKLSSTVDYGGVKYVNGYQQWTYKDASVRRSPRADIEITAEQRNGKRIDEKKVSATRYICKVKITESEYEAFIHSSAGDVEITDAEGKTYAVTGLELNDPQWFRGNGILEFSFNDENNISVYTLNNSPL